MPKITKQGVLRDQKNDNNNNYTKTLHKFESEDENGIKEANFNEKFYESSSEDERSKTNGKTLYDKIENSGDEEGSLNDEEESLNGEEYMESRRKKSKDTCDNKTDDKPTQSYIALIAMAILNSPKRRMVLSDIYQYILENYPFYKTKDKSWRNSIRHNLSLNECFVKVGRSENGKGNYWAIHPSNIEDFAKGDYRRRRARRKTKRPSHPSGLYSECFQPYTILSPILGIGRKTIPNFLGGYERRHSMGQTIPESYPERKPRKSFTIDSILGIENDKKVHPYNSGTLTDLGQRRHHSTPSYSYQRCPSYEGSAFSAFDRNNSAIDCYPFYQGIPLEYQRVPEYLQYTICSTRDSMQELKRLRPSYL